MNDKWNRCIKKLKLTTISELIKNIYCSLSVLIIGCASAYAVEFNKDLIEAEDRENVNLSQFETDGQLPVGKYSLNALINNKKDANPSGPAMGIN
ncbi:hypothetical protein HPE42_02275 [Escherichia coli]|nr:hypothetical protein HPE42_02275 [Escherichia coli]